MSKFNLYWYFILILSGCQPEKNKTIDHDRDLRAELESIFYDDQYYRQKFSIEFARCGQDSDELGELYRLTQETDSINSLKIDKILSEFGWPDLELIGRKGNEAIFLVIQHSNLENQKKYLPLITEAYYENKINDQQMALLKDRISVHESGYQIYGTQLQSKGNTGLYGLYPLLYPEIVDSLRFDMGLDSLHTYVSQWNMERDWRKISSMKIVADDMRSN